MRSPYEQLPEEHVRHFHAFVHYRDLGVERSIAKALAQHKDGCRTGQKRASGDIADWEAWSSKFAWVARVKAFESDLDKVKLEAQKEEAVEMGKRHAKAAALMLDALVAPAMVLTDKLRANPELLNELAASIDDREAVLALLEVVRQTASVAPNVAKMEREARGVGEDSAERGNTVKVVVKLDEGFVV